jgi:hypothetical protein
MDKRVNDKNAAHSETLRRIKERKKEDAFMKPYVHVSGLWGPAQFNQKGRRQ